MGVEYNRMINDYRFQQANKIVHNSKGLGEAWEDIADKEAISLLVDFGLSPQAAYGWIIAWRSGAGDGAY